MAFSTFTVLYSHRSMQFQNVFITPEGSLCPWSSRSSLLPRLNPRQPLVCFLSLCICPHWTFPLDGLIVHLSFCVWLLSLSLVLSRFVHVLTCTFFPFCGWITFHCVDLPHFVHALPSWWLLRLFRFLVIVNFVLWRFVFKFLFEHLFSVLLGLYHGVSLPSF